MYGRKRKIEIGLKVVRNEDIFLEEAAFWLLAFLVEDVLDVDFFGAGTGHTDLIGGRGLTELVQPQGNHRALYYLT